MPLAKSDKEMHSKGVIEQGVIGSALRILTNLVDEYAGQPEDLKS
jgi:hypothetical protein